MKKLFLSLLLMGSSAWAANPFTGIWTGQGTRTDSAGVHTCAYKIEITETNSVLEFEDITFNCGGQDMMDFYGYTQDGSILRDQAGNSVGNFTDDLMQIHVNDNGGEYSDYVILQLKNGKMSYVEAAEYQTESNSSFDANAVLSPQQ